MAHRTAGRSTAGAPGAARAHAGGARRRGALLAASLAAAALVLPARDARRTDGPSQVAPALSLLGTRALGAQTTRGAEIRVPSAPALEGPLVRIVNVLQDRDLLDLLGHGFPLRVHYRTELWTESGWFNDRRGRWEWDLVVRLDPMARRYDVVRIVGEQLTVLGRFATLEEALAAAERPYRVPLVAPRGRRAYYNVVIDVEALSLSDLDEVDRWLRGDLGSAVRRPGTAGTAIGRGLRAVTARLLGGETRHYEVRSPTFRP